MIFGMSVNTGMRPPAKSTAPIMRTIMNFHGSENFDLSTLVKSRKPIVSSTSPASPIARIEGISRLKFWNKGPSAAPTWAGVGFGGRLRFVADTKTVPKIKNVTAQPPTKPTSARTPNHITFVSADFSSGEVPWGIPTVGVWAPTCTGGPLSYLNGLDL